jgi:hypothetical protein
MKNTIKTILASALLVMTFTIFGCRKKDDDGMYQPIGNYQPAGDYGNTTIQSKVFDNYETFQFVIANNDYEDTLKYPAITQSVLDKGSVMVYMQLKTDTTTWWTLPYSNSAAHFQIAYSVGMVRVCCDVNPGFANTLKFRVVLLSPTIRMANPTVNFNKYSEVKKVFNLKD